MVYLHDMKRPVAEVKMYAFENISGLVSENILTDYGFEITLNR